MSKDPRQYNEIDKQQKLTNEIIIDGFFVNLILRKIPLTYF